MKKDVFLILKPIIKKFLVHLIRKKVTLEFRSFEKVSDQNCLVKICEIVQCKRNAKKMVSSKG